jgi:hypothetical protein
VQNCGRGRGKLPDTNAVEENPVFVFMWKPCSRILIFGRLKAAFRYAAIEKAAHEGIQSKDYSYV